MAAPQHTPLATLQAVDVIEARKRWYDSAMTLRQCVIWCIACTPGAGRPAPYKFLYFLGFYALVQGVQGKSPATYTRARAPACA